MRSGSRAGVVAFVTSTLVAFSAWGQTSPSAAPEAPATPYPSPAPATAESSASPVPAEVAVEPPAPPLPTTATLQFDTTDPGASYDVTIETAAGSMHCATIVHREHPCTLHGIAPGTVQVHVVGSTSFDRSVDVEPGDAAVTLHYEAAANGVLPGVLLLVGAVASGVGAALIVWQCGVGTACGNDAYDAFAVPLAILTPAFLIGGIGMMAWSRPASSSVSVMPVDAPLARRSSPLRFRLGAVPVHGGAAVALGAAF